MLLSRAAQLPADPAGAATSPVPAPASSGRPVRPPVRASGAPGRLSGRTFVILTVVVGLIAVYATDQVVPATSSHQADLRVWLAARAAGFMTLGLLTLQVVVGLVLSHPTNKTTWKLSRLIYPWHSNVWVFVLAFLVMHMVTIVADPYAGVGIGGALVPGLSAYRSVPIALGVIALYALLITGLTARYTKSLPRGLWLQIHRLSLGILVLAWTHGVLSGTDSVAMAGAYGASFILVVMAAAYRYWVSRAGRPTFSTSLPETSR
jgi:hypothetical protein